jgi:hypothetical protein
MSPFSFLLFYGLTPPQFYHVVNIFNEQIFVSLLLYIVFFGLDLINVSPDLYYFCLLALGLFCFCFSRSLRFMIRLFI